MYRYPTVYGPMWSAGYEMLWLVLVVIGVMVVAVGTLFLVDFVVHWGRRRRQRPARDLPNPFETDEWRALESNGATGGSEPDEAPRRRSPVRLTYAVAFERMTEGQLEEIRVKAPGAIERLHRAAQLLVRGETAEAESLLFVTRTVVRRGFGEGKHWLEAVIVADIAALNHYRGTTEDADYYFERAAAIVEPWLVKYPWLRKTCTRRRLIRG